jgi:hypothetical protein
MEIRFIKPYIYFLLFLAGFNILHAQDNKQCTYCKKLITGNYIIVDGKSYHPEHFLCSQCGKQIKGEFFKKEGKYYHPECFSTVEGLVCAHCNKVLDKEYIISDGKKYHKACYDNFILSKCSICGKPLTEKYTIDMYGNKYHSSHLNELPKCDCCDRLIAQNLTKGGKALPDGRNICGLCYSTAVFRQPDIENKFYMVSQKLISMGLKLDIRQIRIIGVDRPELKKQARDYSNYMQGYCSSNTETTYLDKKPIKQITAHTIYVLTGISSISLESVIAHELMHSWLYDNTRNNHSDKTREGACNYISYIYLKTLSATASKESIMRLENNPDPAYGGGFRDIRNRFENRPLNELLTYLKN